MYLSSLNSYHHGLPSKYQVHDALTFSAPPLSIDNELEGSPKILLEGSTMTIHSGNSLHQGSVGGDGGKAVKIPGLSFSFRPTPTIEARGPMKADGILNLISVNCAREAGRNILLTKVIRSFLDPSAGSLDLPASIDINSHNLKEQAAEFIAKAKGANAVGGDKSIAFAAPVLSFDPDPLASVPEEDLLAAAAEASHKGLDSILDKLIETSQSGHYLVVWC